MNSSTFDPQILISPAITMQRLQQAASRGHHYWIQGHVPAKKAMNMASKFDDLWDLNLTTNQRYRRRQKGLCVFSLYLYPIDETQSLDWILLRTEGEHPCLDEENWCDIFDSRTRLSWRGYELVKLPYSRAERNAYLERKPDLPTVSLTWRMTKETYEGWKKRIRSSVNTVRRTGSKNTQAYDQTLHSLYRVPGFRGVRRQVFDLRKYINECRKRCKLKAEEFQTPIRYMRARRCKEFPLSELARRADAGEPSWFPEH